MEIKTAVSFNSTFLEKWKDLIENGEQPRDITINGLGTFTNAIIKSDDIDGYTLTYDEYEEEDK